MTTWLPSEDQPNPIDFHPVEAHDKYSNGREQDAAAGGRSARIVTRADGSTTLAVIRVRRRSDLQSRRAYAALRWARAPGDPSEHWIGRVNSPTRRSALAEAWRIVRERDLLTPHGRAADLRRRSHRSKRAP